MASPAIHPNATYHLIAPNTESAFSNTPGLPALAIAAGSAYEDAALLIALCVVVAARLGRNAGGGILRAFVLEDALAVRSADTDAGLVGARVGDFLVRTTAAGGVLVVKAVDGNGATQHSNGGKLHHFLQRYSRRSS